MANNFVAQGPPLLDFAQGSEYPDEHRVFSQVIKLGQLLYMSLHSPANLTGFLIFFIFIFNQCIG